MMDDFIAVMCVIVGVCVLSFNIGKRIDVPAFRIEEAASLCAPNNGLKSLDMFTATCVNGAQFQLKSEEK
jgi:hypothetical protein